MRSTLPRSYLLKLVILSLGLLGGFSSWGRVSRTNPKYWTRKIQADDSNTVAYFNRGVAYYKKKQFQKSIDSFSTVIVRFHELMPVALYYKAQAHLKLNQPEKARGSLKQANTENPPAKLRNRIEFLLSKLDQKKAARIQTPSGSWTASGRVLAGTTDNALYTALSDAESISEDTVQQLQLSAQYARALSSSIQWGALYSGQGTWYIEQSSVDDSYQSLELLGSYRFASRHEIQVRPGYAVTYYSGDHFLNSPMGTFQYSYTRQSWLWTLSFQSLGSEAIASEFDYLNGSSQTLRLGATWFSPTAQMRWELGIPDYQYDDGESFTSSYKGYSVEWSYSQWLGNWSLQPTLFIEDRSFSQADLETKAREDLFQMASLTVGYAVGTAWSVEVELQKIINDSNFGEDEGDRSYERQVVIAGLSWRL